MTLERNGTGTELATSVNFWNWNGASYKNLPKERNGASSISNGALSTTAFGLGMLALGYVVLESVLDCA